jgi:hypothetical protein
MAEYHEFVDQIRAVLQAGQLPDEGTLQVLAEGYAAACAEANERLTSCTRLLHAGRRAEAIHQAEIDPNLLSMLTTLDFPEREDWDALSEQRGLTRAQALKLDDAVALNEAYAQHDPLRDLLRRYRRLALAQAPLAKRIEVLRTIAERDPDTPTWREDVREHEKVRLQQVRVEVGRAAALEDPRALEDLANELETAPWSTPPPPALTRKVHDELGHVRQVLARRALSACVGRLLAAHDARQLDAARNCRAEWNDHMPLARLAENDPLLEQARPALVWLEQEDRREAAERAARTLSAALDQKESSYHHLSALGTSVRSPGRDIPPELAARLNARLKELSRRRWRRALARGAAATVVAVVVGALAIQQVSRFQHNRTATAFAARLNEILETGSLDQAEAYFEKIPPAIVSIGPMVEASKKLDDARKDDKKRRDRLRDLLAEMRQREADQPIPPELDTIQRKKLIRTKKDKDAVDQEVRRYHDRFTDVQAEAEAAFHRRVAEVEDDLVRLENLSRKDIASAEVDNLSQQVQAGLDRLLKDESPALRPPARQEAKALEIRLATVNTERQRWKDRTQLEDRLDRTSAMADFDPAPFTAALKDYVKDFQDTARSLDFKRILDEQPVRVGALTWAKAIEGWSRNAKSLLDVSPQTAAERAKECLQILNDHLNFPDAPLAHRYTSYLEAVARREGLAPRLNNKPIGVREDLEAVWQEEFARRLQVVEFTEGGVHKRRYFADEPVDRATARTFLCYVDMQRANIREFNIPTNVIQLVARTPQCRIADNVNGKKLLQTMRWEEATLQILSDLLAPAQSPEFDAIYQFYLIQQTAELAAEGSLLLSETTTFQSFLNAIQRANIDTGVKWMVPDDLIADRERRQAAEVIRGLPSPKNVKIELQEYQRQLDQEMAQQRIPVGWLAREAASWRVRLAHPVPDGTVLYIPSSVASGKPPWQNVGTAHAPVAILNGAAAGSGDWVEGRPVFQVRNAGRARPR